MNRRRQRDSFAYMFAFDFINRVLQMDHRPPVTISLLAINTLIHYPEILPPQWEWKVSRIMNIRNVCLNPASVLEDMEWKRLLLAAFMHVDNMHLYYNMTSLLWKGARLEKAMGSERFLMMTIEVLLGSHMIYCLLWNALYKVEPKMFMEEFYTSCAVGFSAVLFAYKVILSYHSQTYSTIAGITVPTKYISWVELVLASLANPQSSFMGHLAGILAGLLYVKLRLPTQLAFRLRYS